jgi:hypothetical protein
MRSWPRAASTRPAVLFRDLAFRLPRPRGLRSRAPRPTGPLGRTVSCRLAATEAERLAEQAQECDLPLAAYVRHVLRSSVPSFRRPDVRAAVVALSRVGNDLNQLTRLAHGGTLLSPVLYLEARDRLRPLLRERRSVS